MVIMLLLRVALVLPPAGPVSAVVLHAAVAEAAGVWAGYGVSIAAVGAATDGGVVLPVTLIESRGLPVHPGWRGALGALRFTAAGAPTPAITVFVTDIEQCIAGAHVLGAPEWRWPLRLRDEVFGRVLGRVLAHEIGHYLLRSPRHTRDGLMRSEQLIDDLVSPSRSRYMLTAADVARLGEIR
jgi:hypothetical protein